MLQPCINHAYNCVAGMLCKKAWGNGLLDHISAVSMYMLFRLTLRCARPYPTFNSIKESQVIHYYSPDALKAYQRPTLYFCFSRTLFVQLATARSFVDLYRDKGISRAGSSAHFHARAALQHEEALFAKAALLLFLTSNLIVWAQEKQEAEANLVKHLRNLQARLASSRCRQMQS